MEKRCVVCNKPASFRCTNCKRVFYCSSTCQQRHWYTHKQECGILKKDYTSSTKMETHDFIQHIDFEQDESSITITIQIPLRIRKEDIQVDIYENLITIHSINTEFESEIELFKPIKQSSTSWSFSEGELILYAEKKQKEMWDHLTSQNKLVGDYQTQNLPYFIIFFPSTNKAQIILYTNQSIQEQSIFIKIISIDQDKSSSLLEVRWKDENMFSKQQIPVKAILSIEDVHCEINNTSIQLDFNVKKFNITDFSFVDWIDSQLNREINSLQGHSINLYCSRCSSSLLSSSLSSSEIAPSILWSELCEIMYCDHGGSVHLHSQMNKSGILSEKGKLLVKPSSFYLHPDDCQAIAIQSNQTVCCSECGNVLGWILQDDEKNQAIEVLKDRIKLDSMEKSYLSTTKRILLVLCDVYRLKLNTSFYLDCGKKAVHLTLLSINEFCQNRMNDAIHHAIHFQLDHCEKKEHDFVVSLSLLDYMTFLADCKKASFTNPFLFTCNTSDYFALMD